MARIGKHLRALRGQKGLTQDALAQKLFTSRQRVSHYETGKSNPDIDTLVKIAEALDADVNALIYGPPVPPARKKEARRKIRAS
ncbi:MAG: helix-turn-helix transcriptional regulator [Candidatus Pelethousia sp.]|nr:helix-turn-helix transcriptional regulator [Candidatus Pelethousia sp.]